MPLTSPRRLAVSGIVLFAASCALALASAPGRAVGAPAPAAAPRTASAPVSAAESPSVEPSVPPAPTWRQFGTSVRGRPIEVISFGSGSRKVLVVGGMHGNEHGAPVAAAFATYLLANPSAVPSDTQIDIVAVANPDGFAYRRRSNANGVDLNRNFPARNWRRIRTRGATSGRSPASEPETRALIELQAATGYTRVIALHSKGGIVDYDGRGGWTLAKRFSAVVKWRIKRLAATRRYNGSLGSWMPEQGAPVITIELQNRVLSPRLLRGLLAVVR